MLTVTVNSTEVQDLLAKLSARLADMTPAMNTIGAKLETRVSARFETQTDPLGNPWKQWADSTSKGYPYPGSQAAQGDDGAGNGRILDRFGHMLGGISWEANAKSATIGFDQPYAQYHEFGAPSNNMPRRGLLTADPNRGTLGPGDEAAVLEILSDFLSGL